MVKCGIWSGPLGQPRLTWTVSGMVHVAVPLGPYAGPLLPPPGAVGALPPSADLRATSIGFGAVDSSISLSNSSFIGSFTLLRRSATIAETRTPSLAIQPITFLLASSLGTPI